jgi:hypothetical protein
MFEDIDLLCADLAAERWQVYTHARHAKSGFLSRLMDEVTACRAQMGPCAMTQVCTWFLDYRLGYISSQILQCHCSVHVRLCPFFIVNLRFCVLLAGIAVPCIESGYWREPAAATIDISDFSTFKIFRCEVYDVCRGEAVAVVVGCL